METLGEHERKASLHGLGFAQIKLDGDLRLHVWHPDLPQRDFAAYSQIHDHRFGFVSTVLVGGIANTMYDRAPAKDDWRVGLHRFDAYNHEGERLPTGNRPWTHIGVLGLRTRHETLIAPGRWYTVQPFDFHSTRPMRSDGIVVTVMRKFVVRDDKSATTLVRESMPYDPDFDRFQMPEEEIMDIVKKALSS